MILQTIRARKVYFLLVVMMILSFLSGNNLSLAQEVQSQKDTLRLNDEYFVQREFNYRLSGDDTVFHGRHSLFLKPFLNNEITSRKYDYEHLEVNFDNNQKQGPFQQKVVSFRPDINRFNPEGQQLTIPYTGNRVELRGQYEENKPSGQWFLSQFEQTAGVAADTILLLYTSFGAEGALEQDFRINDKQAEQEIRGEFSTDGGFSDTLEVRNNAGDRMATYYFEEGLLTSIKVPGKRAIQPAYTENSSEYTFQAHSLDSMYIKILSYYLQKVPSEELDQLLDPLNAVYHAFEFLSGGESLLLDHLPGEFNIQAPVVKLPAFEPDSQEVEVIKDAQDRLVKLHHQVDSLMNMSAFSLNRYVDRELSSLYAQGNLLRKKVGRQRSVIEVLSAPLIQHIDPEWFLQRRLDEIKQQDTVAYSFNEQSYREEMDFSFDNGGLTPFEQYESYLSRLEEVYADINKRSIGRINRLRLDTRMEESEDRIASLSAEIDRLADTMSLNLYGPKFSQQFKQAFLDFKEHQLAQFASMEHQQRMIEGDSLVSCMEQMKSRLEKAPLLAKKEKIVDEAYMDTRLNPYTFTEMNVRLYERLFTAYQEVLVPYMLQNMRPAGSCENFLHSVDNLEILQDFMLDALEGNPGRLDRRARNRDNAEAIIRRLGIPLVLK